MTMRDGGTAFEVVSVPGGRQEEELTTALQARNSGLPSFQRRRSTKDYELGQDTWSPSRSIWSTSKSILGGDVDDAPMRRRLWLDYEENRTNPLLSASPVREESLSSHSQARTTTSAFQLPADSNNENLLRSKLPWGSVPVSAGFSTRHRNQPLSPTQQRQNQGRELRVDKSNGNHGHTSLFAGSDPDVDDLTYDAQQFQDQRRGLAGGSRADPCPTRGLAFGPNSQSSQNHAFNLDRYYASGISPSVQDFEYEQERARAVNGFQHPNEVLNRSSLLHSHETFSAADGMSSELLYRHNAASPTNGRANERPENPGRLDDIRRTTNQDHYVDTMRSFEDMSLDQTNADLVARRLHINQPQFPRDASRTPAQNGSLERFYPLAAHDPNLELRLNPQAPPHYGGYQYAVRGSLPPPTNDYRSTLNSPYYSTTGTPPTGPQSVRSTPRSGVSSRTSHHDPFLYDRNFAVVDQYGTDGSMYNPTSGRLPMHTGFHYDTHMSGQPMRMNPLAVPYVAPEHDGMQNYPSGPRMSVREPEQPHIVRSPLLEEFRLHSRHNRRYELKDIYGYVVEFSGDQHGSRFIQQKLETANSDEKEQIFKELQPNLLQLMTDVFGNYVIQKIFEHGNQTQKKILANHMKGHVLPLSMQMYGCRVVQKAFEHVLVDQQASLVKELDGSNSQVLKVVKDQNGNHVVQKAIERIPGEHIQFIIDAHRGQMAKMSTHQYGCRVVQRMLEHCQPPVKRVILDELLEHIHPLISDSYGNYVVQHIIQNGELRDRRQVVDIILHQLLVFSKHKFASNIVEKSIDCADEDQREQILQGLTGPDETGVTPVLGLMRDQYGNYVLRKSQSLPSRIQVH